MAPVRLTILGFGLLSTMATILFQQVVHDSTLDFIATLLNLGVTGLVLILLYTGKLRPETVVQQERERERELTDRIVAIHQARVDEMVKQQSEINARLIASQDATLERLVDHDKWERENALVIRKELKPRRRRR